MTMLASQITSLAVVYSIVYSGVNQRKHQSSASLALVREIHRRPVNFPHKWPVTRKMFPFDDAIMAWLLLVTKMHKASKIIHCLNQCCLIDDLALTDKFLPNSIRIWTFSFRQICLKVPCAKYLQVCSRLFQQAFQLQHYAGITWASWHHKSPTTRRFSSYRKTFSISHTKSQSLMFLVSSRSCLRSIHWSQVLSWEWRCCWSSADRRCSNYIWVINNFIAY